MTSEQVGASRVSAEIERVIAGYGRLLQMLTPSRSAGIFESSVTMAQLKVLMLLGAMEESRMSEVASALHLSLSTVSGLVDRLVENGLASRRTDHVDRRQVLVSLTSEGAAFLESFQELGMQQLRELLAQLSPAELDDVAAAMDLLIKAAERSMNKENE